MPPRLGPCIDNMPRKFVADCHGIGQRAQHFNAERFFRVVDADIGAAYSPCKHFNDNIVGRFDFRNRLIEELKSRHPFFAFNRLIFCDRFHD